MQWSPAMTLWNNYEQLAERTTEIKRMLTVLVQKLTADRQAER